MGDPIGKGAQPVFQLVVQFNPGTGQLAVSLPQADAMVVLAMLEMAKLQVTMRAMGQQFGIEQSSIIKPPPGTKLQS